MNWGQAGLGLLALALVSAAIPGALLGAGATTTVVTATETTDHDEAERIGNGNISITHAGEYLRGMRFPADTNNTFLEPAAWAHAFTHEGQVLGVAHGDIFIEGFRALDNHTLVNREVTGDGEISVTTQAKVPANGTSAVIVTYWIKNLGEDTEEVRLYPFAEPNANGADNETTTFDEDNQTIWATNDHGANATLTTLPCFAPNGHAIADIDVLDMIEQEDLNNASSDTGDTWFTFRERRGLGPNETDQVSLVLEPTLDGPRAPNGGTLCPDATAPPVEFLESALPGAPQDLRAEERKGAVELDWRPPADDTEVEYYRIYRGTDSCEDARPIDFTDDLQTYFVDRTADHEQTYCYFVTAINDFGEGPASENVTASPLPPIDLAIGEITVDKQEVRTDYAPGVVNPAGDHEITVEITNHGSATEHPVFLDVRLCPEEGAAATPLTDRCEEDRETYVEALDTGETTTFSFTWESLGEIGDYEICAQADSVGFEDELENNHRCETTFSVVGGTGQGGANAPLLD